MKNKNGFSLIELLAAIAILAVLGTVSVIAVERVLKKSDKDIDKFQKQMLESAVKAYLSDNFITNGTHFISIDELEEYIDKYDKVKEEYICVKIIKENKKINTQAIKDENICDKTFVIDNQTLTEYMGTSQTSIQIPDGIEKIDDSVFKNKSLTEIKIPNSVTSIGTSAFQFNQLTNVVIPNSVTTIGNYAFASNYLEEVAIPNSVTSIGEGAFEGNELTSVTIPNSVTSIGSYAFVNNPNLTKIIFEGRNDLNGLTLGNAWSGTCTNIICGNIPCSN